MFFKKFKSAPVVSEAKPSGNPYLDGRAEWLERYGDYIAQAQQWRRAALGALLVCILSVLGNVIQATQNKTLPYVVAVDSLGNVHSAGAARNLRPTDIPASAIQAELANYVRNWRAVTADADLQTRMLERLVAFSSGAAQTFLQEWYAANNPYKRAESVLVSVDLKGLPQQVGQQSWRVEWTETSRDRQGKALEQTKYEATLSVGLAPPRSEAEILQNPLGIVVASVYFSKLLQQ